MQNLRIRTEIPLRNDSFNQTAETRSSIRESSRRRDARLIIFKSDPSFFLVPGGSDFIQLHNLDDLII